jgi:hypothetical protein
MSHPYKIGRNDPCFCGSGKKYKKCCVEEMQKHVTESDLEDSMQIFSHKIKKDYPQIKRFVFSQEDNLPKMSEILMEFGSDFIEEAEKDDEIEIILTICVVAWNLSFLDVQEINEAIESFLKLKELEHDKEELRAILTELIDRKAIEYPHINRVIQHFEFIKTKNGRVFNVASTESSPTIIQ